MARPYGSDPGRWSEDRRRWTEGEDIRSGTGEGQRRDYGRYDSTRDMDFGGGYGGGEDRRYRSERDEERWSGSQWERDRGGSRGGWHEDRDREWRDRGGGMMSESDRGHWSEERSSGHDQGPGGGYRGGYGGTSGYGSSSGGYGASGLTGSAGRWGQGGAGYSGGGYSAGGGGFGGGGSYGGGRYGRGGEESYGESYGGRGGQYGAQHWRAEPSRGERDYRGEERWGGQRDERGFMERMGDTFRHGMEKLTGRGPKGYRRSDERIREDVCERIARSGMNAEDVEVQVENGEVTLSGEVENRWDKRRLEDLVEDLFGVDEVHNHLRLRRETSTSTESRTDRETGTSGLPH